MLKKIIVLAITAVAPYLAVAQKPAIVQHINDSGNITIHQPEALNRLVSMSSSDSHNSASVDAAEPMSATSQSTTRTGYRVQIFDDNNPRTARSGAEACHSRVMAAFPHMRAYVTFNSPYWRVKVGDFRTRAEAEAAMAELRHAFPSMSAYMRIVRDKINISD